MVMMMMMMMSMVMIYGHDDDGVKNDHYEYGGDQDDSEEDEYDSEEDEYDDDDEYDDEHDHEYDDDDEYDEHDHEYDKYDIQYIFTYLQVQSSLLRPAVVSCPSSPTRSRIPQLLPLYVFDYYSLCAYIEQIPPRRLQPRIRRQLVTSKSKVNKQYV